MTKTKLLILSLIVVLLGIAGFSIYFLHQNPLVSDGYSEYNLRRKKVDISLMNKGNRDITIQEVQVNGQPPQKAQLVISYSEHLVASGIDFDPKAKFLEINEQPIRPELSPAKRQQALHSSTIPIHYGIRIFNAEDIESVKIMYKYWGFPFVRKINFHTGP